MIRRFFLLVLGALPLWGAEATIEDRVQFSQTFSETRNFRIFLPPDYATSAKRYPVVYWFHDAGERFNKPADQPGHNYDSGSDYGGDNIANYVARHDLIVVKWDGFNPRFNGDNYNRPYNVGPVETTRQFPLYFPELVDFVDANFRTIADREHRGTSGLGMGGFMSFWIAGKYPQLVSSASSFMGSPEFLVGPRDFPVEYSHDVMYANYDGVRTRLVVGTRDFAQFYGHQLNGIWKYARDWHETEDVDSDHGTPGIGKTLDFHMNAFSHPLPRPNTWSHADVYPNFGIWGWEVGTDRKQPGVTLLTDVSAAGFRSAVREWLPDGSPIPEVKVSIETDKLYPPRKPQTVTFVRRRDGKVRRETVTASADGRLSLDLDGDDYEVGISPGPVLALAGYQLDGSAWPTAGEGVHVRFRIWNKGAAASRPGTLRWMSPNFGLEVAPLTSDLPAIAAGQSLEVPVTITARDLKREVARVLAVQGDTRMPAEIPLYPPARPFPDFRLADGAAVRVYQHATQKIELTLGDGNGDGKANAGERVAILLPEDDVYRVAEVITNDACVDNSLRGFDDWSDYDHVGASAKYTLPLIRPDCPKGHVIHALARVLLPDKPNDVMRYAAIDIPVDSK